MGDVFNRSPALIRSVNRCDFRVGRSHAKRTVPGGVIGVNCHKDDQAQDNDGDGRPAETGPEPDSEHPVYCLAQDPFDVATLKGEQSVSRRLSIPVAESIKTFGSVS
jgi:hypothetical protein